MKLSVFAVLLADRSLDDACKYLKDSGVQAIEIGAGGFPGKAHCNPAELLKDDKKIEEFRNTIEKHGLEIAALSTHGNAVHPDPAVAKVFHDDYVNTVLLAEKLGVTLQELENWQCCGGAFSMGKDEIASKLASVRALNAAKEQGQDLVTLCSACHNVLKQANDAMANDAEFSDHANNYMQLDQPYRGETKVIHYLELLRDVVGFENVKKAVVNPLKGRKIAAYYGCLLLRPGKVMQMDNPENPRIMEDFIRAIGAEPVLWANRNECCGGYAVMEDKKIAQKKSTAVMENAADMQADTLVTACPLCLYNLTKNASGEHRLPVVYFTELLAEALGVKD